MIYFGAGLWSKYGVAIHALDARSGRVVWSNTDSNHIPKANMDHGIAHEAGLTPQGYLAVVNETLVVPCGAQLPAFLDLKTGRLAAYTMGWGGRNGLPKGTWFVAGTRNYLSHGGDLYDITRPNDEQFDDARLRTDFKTMLYPGGFTRLEIDPTNQKDLGAFREPVFAADVMYDNDRGIVALNLGGVKLEERKKSAIPPERRDDTYPDKWKMAFRETLAAALETEGPHQGRGASLPGRRRRGRRQCASPRAAKHRRSCGAERSRGRRIACWPPAAGCSW